MRFSIIAFMAAGAFALPLIERQEPPTPAGGYTGEHPHHHHHHAGQYSGRPHPTGGYPSGLPSAPFPTGGYPGGPSPTGGVPGAPLPTGGYPGAPAPTGGFPSAPPLYPHPTQSAGASHFHYPHQPAESPAAPLYL